MDVKKMKSRFIALAVSVMLVVSVLPVSALATSVDCEHEYVNGFCTVCDNIESAVMLTENNLSDFGLSNEYTGYYAIGNAGQLYWFSDLVGSYEGEEHLNAVLTADIVDNENVLTESGELSENHEDFSQWQPIGYLVEETEDYSGYYEGTFDGNNHSISGLYFNNSTESNIGLFGYVRYDSCIKNLTLKDSYFKGENNVAGICAIMHRGSDSTITGGRTYIENCVNYATIVSTEKAGGICAVPAIYVTIKNCENNGNIYVCDETEADTLALYAGGITGSLSSDNYIENCVNNGNVTITDCGSFDESFAGGICGTVSGSIVNCVNKGTVCAPQTVGGICGSLNNKGYITKCRNDGTIIAEESCVGGIVGKFDLIYTQEVFLTSCYNTGSVTGNTFVGGIVGLHGRFGHEDYLLTAIISKTYNLGTVVGELYVGAITGLTGDYGQLTDSFYLLGSAEKTDGTAVTGWNWYGTAQYEMQIGDEKGYSLGVTNEQFASGEITFALNGYESHSDVVWYQNIDRGDEPQLYPTFEGERVYYIDNIYTNIPVEENHDHIYTNGYCTYPDCTVFESGVKITESNYKDYGLTSCYIGYFGVGNAGQLYWLAQLLEMDSSPNIVLLDNIVDNTGVLDLNGNLVSGNYKKWTPLGSDSEQYFGGIFDGNGKTISGLYYTSTTNTCVGFLGYCKGATIKNLKIADSYFKAKYWAGGICAYAENTVIENCVNSACVEVKSDSAGGICGSAYLSTINNCTNRGNIASQITASPASNGFTGGICGKIASSDISGCKNFGSVKGEVYVGGIVGYVSSKVNLITGCSNEGTVYAKSIVAGGIVGLSEATDVDIIKCFNKGQVTALRKAGGICGSTLHPLYIHNCYNTGDISATESIVGGICGHIYADKEAVICVEACYNIGNVTAPQYVGGVAGGISELSVFKNCYYLENCAFDSENILKNGVGCHNTYSENYDVLDSDVGIEAVSKEQLTSGELAYILQSVQTADEETGEIPMVWGQTSNRENAYPILTDNEVHKVIGSNGTTGYSVSNFGDINNNGEIEVTDYQELVNQVVSDGHEQTGTAEYSEIIKYDLNGDGAIDVLDAALMSLVINGHRTIDVYDIGDIDFNGVAFEEADIAAIQESIKNPTKLTTAEKRACDLNSDGVVDDEDWVAFDIEYGSQGCNDCNGTILAEYTWSEDFSSCRASSYCSVCKTIKVSETVESTAELTIEPTCLSSGKCLFTATFTHPSFETKNHEEIIAALGHKYDTITYTWADDYSTCNGVTVCSRCNSGRVYQTVDSVYTIEAGDCLSSGTVAYTATFTKAPLEKQTCTFEKEYIEHLYDEVEYVWADDYSSCSASTYCLGCGGEQTSATVEAASTVTRKATCTVTGIIKHTATFEEAVLGTTTKNQIVSKTDHPYETEYVWAEDFSSCTATSACSGCSVVEAEETVNSECYVLCEATCQADGQGEYTATFTNEIFEAQICVGIIPATSHHFSNVTYTWSGNNAYCTAEGICQQCGNNVTETATASYSGNLIIATFVSTGLETQTIETDITVYTSATEVYNFVSSQLSAGNENITVPLAQNASADLITAIRRAICEADNVADGSINLTITGVTTIPDNIYVDETGAMTDGIAFGPDSFVLAGGIETVPELKSISLPDAMYIGEGAFDQCCNLSSLYAPKVQTVGMYAFSETALSVIDLPEATAVGVAAFGYGYAEITYVNLPKATALGVDLFNHLPTMPNNFAEGATVKLTAPGAEFTWLQIDENSFSSKPNLFNSDSEELINLVLHTDKSSQIKKNFLSGYKWSFTYATSTISYNCLSITTEG